jgi:hypothetical protein
MAGNIDPVSVGGIVKPDIVDHKKYEKDYLLVTRSRIMYKIIDKKGDGKKINGYADIHKPVQCGQGQLYRPADLRKNPIVQTEQQIGTIGIVSEFVQMHGEGKEGKDHSRAHYQEEPTITFLVFGKYQNNRE